MAVSRITSPGTVINASSGPGPGAQLGAVRQIGEAGRKLAGAISQVGEDVDEFDRDMKVKRATRDAGDAYLEASDLAHDDVNRDFLATTLEDADGVTKRAATRFKEIERGFEQMSPAAREIAIPRWRERRSQFLRTIAQHEQAQGDEVLRAQRTSFIAQEEINITENAGDPFVVQMSIDRIADTLRNSDLTREQQDIAIVESASKNWVAAVAQVAETDPEYAQELLAEHSGKDAPVNGKILARDVPALKERVKLEDDQAQADLWVVDFMAGKDPMTTNITTAQQAARDAFKKNPDAARKAAERVRLDIGRRRTEIQFQRSERNMLSVIEIDKHLQKGAFEDALDVAEKSKDPGFKTAQTRRIKDLMANKRVDSKPGAVEKYALMSFEERQSVNVWADGDLTQGDAEKIQGELIDDRKARQKTAESRWTQMRAERKVRAFVALGIPLDGQELKDGNEKELATTFERNFETEILAFQDAHENRKPDRDELDSIVKAMLFETVSRGSFFGFTFRQGFRRFQLGTTDDFQELAPRPDAVTASEILPSVKSDIRLLLQRAGLPTGDADVLAKFNDIQRDRRQATGNDVITSGRVLGGGVR